LLRISILKHQHPLHRKSRRARARVLAGGPAFKTSEGAGKCRALDSARSRVWFCEIKHTRCQTTVHPLTHHGIPRANVFNCFLPLRRPIDRLFLPLSSAECPFRQILTPASGRQDHMTSPSSARACVNIAPPASTASRLLRPRDGSERPSVARDGNGCRFDLVNPERILFATRTDRANHIDPAHKFDIYASSFPRIPSTRIAAATGN